MPAVDVAVVGGGMAGLSTAYELHRQGIAFILCEATDRLGGVVRTDRVDGFTLDAGPDSLLVQKPAAIELCHELGLGDRLVPTLEPRTAFVLHGHLRPIPEASVLGIPTALTPWIKSTLLSPLAKLRLAADLVRPQGAGDDESVASFFRRRFGPAAVEYIAEPLLAGIHAGDVDQLSMRALFPRLMQAERTHGSVIRALRTLRRSVPRPTQGLFRSLRGGIEELASTLSSTLPKSALRCGTRVSAISGPSPYTIRLEGAEPLSARSVVLASPAHVTAGLVAGIDDHLAMLCRQIPYTSTATVLLSYPRVAVRRPRTGSGFVVPRRERQAGLMAGSWVTSKWPGRAPKGHVLLRGFLGGVRDPDVISRSDDELVSIAHETFAKVLDLDRPPDLKRVYRWPRANPQHIVGHLSRMASIETQLKQYPGLFVTGSGFRGVGIPDCVADGRATARAVVAWRADRSPA
ncbi:MAG: protoporphyrinogen oxidase [Acidobacteriota bacterium]|nr:protoporphyrinogen oxidase [Acidobacteriota bacterium]